ncbi:MAG: hypothetical protein D6798_04235 [Deltaproteobacteria bacterium]|nr:MAG: hypothetical protein D6798_04235 [Deltaproteobacteria bacterium]
MPAPPAGVAEVTKTDEGGGVTVQLRLERCWAHRRIAGDGDPSVQRDPVHTGLTPTLEASLGTETCLWTGYRPGTHEQAGDTLLTYALLIEHPPAGPLHAFWYEDHQEVPRTLYAGQGSLDGHQLRLQLVDVDGGPPATLEGLVRRPEHR